MDLAEQALTSAGVYLAARNPERAVDVLGTALARQTNDVRLLTELARAQLQMDRPELAESSAQAALRAVPDHAPALRMYALALAGLEERDDAMEVAYRAVLATPDDFTSHYVYAVVLYKAWRYEVALQAITEAQRLCPGSADVHVQRGLILAQLRLIDESTTAYEEALRLDPTHAEAVLCLGANSLHRNRWRGALHNFLDAARMEPRLGDAARQSVGAALRTPLRWATALSAVVCVLVVTGAGNQGSAVEHGVRRVCAALAVGALVTLLVWVGREARVVPRAAWLSILRSNPAIAVRLTIAAAAVVIAVPCVLGIAPKNLAVAAVGLFFIALLVMYSGWKKGF
jgi:tetratricopeptide (TPR) repeat protein